MAKTLKKRSTLPRKIREGEIKLEDLSPEEQEKVRNNLYKTTRASRKNKDGVKFGSLGAPNSAQRKLIERYKANNPDKLVKNTIAKLIDAELPNIKKAIENHKICGDGEFTKKCSAWIEEKTGTKKALHELKRKNDRKHCFPVIFLIISSLS